jgi:glyoxylase-like metal-dependent hydrolase (beta-lactamase superfamily II)
MPAIYAIDAEYVRPRLAAVHLLIQDGRAALVDSGTSKSLPQTLAALAAHGLKPADVDYVFLTHVHLDHAGGAGTLMRLLPNARCVLHPRGARHMVDPSKLIAAAREVYGDTKFEALYGDLPPIAPNRIITVEDGQRLYVGSCELTFLHTAGHANHHYCIVDKVGGAIFSGDTFGLSYRELDTENGPFILPTTTPSQFDPAAAHASIDRLMNYSPRAIYLTHYSRIDTHLSKLANDLHEQLDAYVAIAEKHVAAPERAQAMIEDLYAYTSERLDRHGVRQDARFRHEQLDGDIELNVQGLIVWLDRKL